MNTTIATMTAQQLCEAVKTKSVSVADAITLLETRIAKAEAEGRKARAPSVQLLAELKALKPKASVSALKNPVEALREAKAAKAPAKQEKPAKAPAKAPVKAKTPAKQEKPAAKAADANVTLGDAELLSLVSQRMKDDAVFAGAIGRLFIEIVQSRK